MDSEFERYNNSDKKKKKKKKSNKSKDHMKKKNKKISIDDLIDPNTELTDIQRVMKKNRELLLENEILKAKLKNYN